MVTGARLRNVRLKKLRHIIQAVMPWTNGHFYQFSFSDAIYSGPAFHIGKTLAQCRSGTSPNPC
jgi:hypothetical protein